MWEKLNDRILFGRPHVSRGTSPWEKKPEDPYFVWSDKIAVLFSIVPYAISIAHGAAVKTLIPGIEDKIVLKLLKLGMVAIFKYLKYFKILNDF